MYIAHDKVKLLNHVLLFEILLTIAYQVPPFMAFSRQEYWSGLPFPSPGDLPNLGIKPRSSVLWADVLPSEPPGKLENGKMNAKSLNDFNITYMLKK